MGNKGLKYRFKQVTEDHGSWWIQKYAVFRYKRVWFFSGIWTRAIAHVKGVELGRECQFNGIPYFSRYPKTKIQLGNKCRLRSNHLSNLIGINHPCIISTLHPGAVIKIGDNCGMSGASIGAAKEIIIGDNVLIGANCIITDNDWHSDRFAAPPASVIIHDNVWLGVNSVVLKGVEIGENAIIGANSLVVKNIPANVIAGGNPCKVIKNLD